MIKGRMNQNPNYASSNSTLEVPATIHTPMTGESMTTYHIALSGKQKIQFRQTDEGWDIIVRGNGG